MITKNQSVGMMALVPLRILSTYFLRNSEIWNAGPRPKDKSISHLLALFCSIKPRFLVHLSLLIHTHIDFTLSLSLEMRVKRKLA